MRVEEDHAARAEAGSGAASSPPERQDDGVRLVIKNPAHDYDDYACRVRFCFRISILICCLLYTNYCFVTPRPRPRAGAMGLDRR